MATFTIKEILTLGVDRITMTDWTVSRDEDWDNPIKESLEDTVNLDEWRTPLYEDGRLLRNCTGVKCRTRVKYGEKWSEYFILTSR